MKITTKVYELPLRFLEIVSKIIAFLVCIGLLITSGYIVIRSFNSLLDGNLNIAVQDGLFVLILLEMFYVTRSFINYGTINVSLIISVGVIAAVKEMTFRLETMTMQTAIGFGVIFITLSVTYFMERLYYEKMVKNH